MHVKVISSQKGSDKKASIEACSMAAIFDKNRNDLVLTERRASGEQLFQDRCGL